MEFCRLVDQYESDLLSAVHPILLSMNDRDHLTKCSPCKGSCIKFVLVKLLRNSGYDAAVCGSNGGVVSKSQKGFGTEDLVGCLEVERNNGLARLDGIRSFSRDAPVLDEVKEELEGEDLRRMFIDIDFWDYFEIARAVESYEKILKTLPTVYVGSTAKLKQLLQVMAEAVRTSLKQNPLPLPPWRSLAYLWQSGTLPTRGG